MKYALAVSMALSCLALSAPAFAQGDLRAETEQAQMHPSQPNQEPFAAANGVALGEVYYAPGGGYGYRKHAGENQPCRVEPSLCSP